MEFTDKDVKQLRLLIKDVLTFDRTERLKEERVLREKEKARKEAKHLANFLEKKKNFQLPSKSNIFDAIYYQLDHCYEKSEGNCGYDIEEYLCDSEQFLEVKKEIFKLINDFVNQIVVPPSQKP